MNRDREDEPTHEHVRVTDIIGHVDPRADHRGGGGWYATSAVVTLSRFTGGKYKVINGMAKTTRPASVEFIEADVYRGLDPAAEVRLYLKLNGKAGR
jgi:hypothetical protein